MAKGVSLHIGVNSVSENYKPSMMVPPLEGAIHDANAMQALTTAAGFESSKALLNVEATTQAFLDELTKAANDLEEGDLFVITYSGHGRDVKDTSGDEGDQFDETWVLYDRLLIDDELAEAWTWFKKGVRIFVVLDMCNGHSAIARKFPFDIGFLPQYQKIKAKLNQKRRDSDIKASVLSISASMSNEQAIERNGKGVFTEGLIEVWDQGNFIGNYEILREEINKKRAVPPFFWALKKDQDFLNSRPFSFEPDVQTEHVTSPAGDQNSQPSTSNPDPYEGLNLKPWQKELARMGDGLLRWGLSRLNGR